MNRYHLQRELGRGTSGIVYKALDTLTAQVVAVKVFHNLPGAPVREVFIAHQVTHLNVCRIYLYFVEEDGTKLLVMEYIDGRTLADRLLEGPLSWSEAQAIVVEILNGLKAIHEMKHIHFDLKPSNLMLTRDGHVKILDLGQARPIDPVDFETGNTPGGTPAYGAPEQAMGAKCDARADLFCFGRVLGEMLSGVRPRPPAPLELPPGVPGDVKGVVERCIEIDRKNRYNSVDQVRVALGLEAPKLQLSKGRTALLAASAIALILVAVYFFSSVGAVDREGSRLSRPAARVPSVPSTEKVAKQQPKTIHRVAVLNFLNLSGDSALDPYTAGIAETITAELAQVTGLTVVERARVIDTVHDVEIPKFDQLPAATAREIGKAIGVDALIIGSFQTTGNDVRLIGRIVDPITGEVIRSASTADGPFKDLFKLQGDLARQLAVLIVAAAQGPEKQAPTGHSIEAFQAFSSGVYFLQNDLAAGALKAFDRTIASDPQYPAANYYRGLALEKLNRLDEASDALMRALPQSESEKTVLSNWDPMYANPIRGMIRANNAAAFHNQRDLFAPRKATPLQRAVYAERNGKSTVLQFVNLEKGSVRRVEVADENIILTNAYGNDTLTLVASIDANAPPAQRKIGLYAFAKDGSLGWHSELADFGNDAPRFAPIGTDVYIYYPALQRFDLLEGRTGDRLWRRDDLAVDGTEAPWTARTKAYGEIFIFKSRDTYRAIRKSDGSDAWSVSVHSEKPSELLTEKGLAVFEPERRVFFVDLETGKAAGEIAIEQYADVLRTVAGPKWLAGAMAQGNVLYILSKDFEVCAIDLTKFRLLWRTPVQRRVQHFRLLRNRLYLGTAQGDILVLDAASGGILNTIKVTDRGVLLDRVDEDGLVVRSNNTLYGFTLDGAKIWEYPSVDMGPGVTFLNGTAVVYNSPLQISAVETATGKQIWHYEGPETPAVLAEAGRLFILDVTGIKEYATAAQANAVTDKDTETELARTYLARHDLVQARVFAAKASSLDPDYPPLVLLEARLSQAEGNKARSGKELARYADLTGLDSKEGRRTIAELKRDHRLLWVSDVGFDVAGDPVLIGDRLVSAGRKSAQDAEGVPLDRSIVGLDPDTGALAWRFPTERFTASVAVKDPLPYLYYAAGSQADLNSVFLYRVDVRTGDRKQLATWKGKQRIDQAWIAYAAGRIFVASVVPDINTHTVQVFVDAFDAVSGARAWTHNQTLKIGSRDAGEPIRMFAAHDNAVMYSVGQQTYALRATDGSLQAAVPPAAVAKQNNRKLDLLWPASTTLVDGRRVFAFTAHGHAFALKLPA